VRKVFIRIWRMRGNEFMCQWRRRKNESWRNTPTDVKVGRDPPSPQGEGGSKIVILQVPTSKSANILLFNRLARPGGGGGGLYS